MPKVYFLLVSLFLGFIITLYYEFCQLFFMSFLDLILFFWEKPYGNFLR
nr:MAG TPA: hypothetical protein [Caudoviricetes sp.]